MKIIKKTVDMYDITNTGFKYKGTEEREYPDLGRHCEWCSICGFPGYPECREDCTNEKIYQEELRQKNNENRV